MPDLITTYKGMQDRLYRQVQRADLLADGMYGVFINEALREIQNRRSWSVMKNTVDIHIPNGSATVSDFPTDFKEFQNLRPPMSIVLTDPSTDSEVLKPIDVVDELQELRRVWNFGGLVWTLRVIADQNTGTTSVSIIVPAAEDLTLRMKYYRYLPLLTGDNDTNWFLQNFPRVVWSKAKANAFYEINDTKAEDDAGREFESELQRAMRQDAWSAVAGMSARM